MPKVPYTVYKTVQKPRVYRGSVRIKGLASVRTLYVVFGAFMNLIFSVYKLPL